ncbi:hypothetical protein BaRGS_00022440 [Batillaria attramentaria]|uniref:Uncharacterized protein n=1 Tax=Batillaria attramentaria TaxID=370345 RepID=A0ABD0KGG8_9CAEN
MTVAGGGLVARRTGQVRRCVQTARGEASERASANGIARLFLADYALSARGFVSGGVTRGDCVIHGAPPSGHEVLVAV